MHKFKVTNKNTGFVVQHTVNTKSENVAFKIMRAFFSNNYTITLIK